MEKVLFLDFDGVIRDPEGFNAERMDWIAGMCENMGVQIVVSSDHRHFNGLTAIKMEMEHKITDYFHADWMTPVVGHRHNEVERWLSEHPEVEKFVVIDDFDVHFEGCSSYIRDSLVLCETKTGLTISIFNKVVYKFSGKEMYEFTQADRDNLSVLGQHIKDNPASKTRYMGAIDLILDKKSKISVALT